MVCAVACFLMTSIFWMVLYNDLCCSVLYDKYILMFCAAVFFIMTIIY